MRILLCFGTRPEAIKMAPLVLELKKEKLSFKVCVTAQHREMLDQVLDFFEIIPDYDLHLMETGQSLNSLSSRVLEKFDEVLELEKPNLVLVHGDTTTSSMAALAAFHRGIKVGHVEAGLRTYNKNSPFPEEINRQITGRIADFHFAPTESAKENLLKEKIAEENVIITGNTVIDALEWAVEKLENSYKNKELEKVEKFLNSESKTILVTGHRRENFGQGFRNLCEAILKISKMENVKIAWPVHLNPNVKKPVNEILSSQKSIKLMEPVSYPTFVWLMKNCHLIISDSGGIQEEAPTLKKPVLVTRNTSERMEGVEAGFSTLVGTNKGLIIDKAVELLKNLPSFEGKKNPYGDGKASVRILKFIKNL